MVKFRPGMRVEVPWELGVLTGIVADVFGSGSDTVVMVDVDLAPDTEDSLVQEIGFRAEVVRPISERAAS